MDFLVIIKPIISIFLYLIPIFIIAGVIKSPWFNSWFKGVVGEWIVNFSVKLMLDKEKYHLIKNVTLPTNDGSTQIDHVIVSIYGIFVIETKNMKGLISGNPSYDEWKQKTNRGSYEFQNPLRQNCKHVKTLQELLGITDEQIFSLVVFVGNNAFKKEMPENVTQGGRGCVRYIKSKTQPILSKSEVSEIINKIENTRFEPSRKTDRAHVKHVKDIKKGKNIGKKF